MVGNLVGKAASNPMVGNMMSRAAGSSLGQKVIGRTMSSGTGLITRFTDNERNSNMISKFSASFLQHSLTSILMPSVKGIIKVFQAIAKVVIKVLAVIQNIWTALIISVFNILGFVAELPLALFTAMKMNFALLSSTMDKYGISLNGMINSIRFIFKLDPPVSAENSAMGYQGYGMMNGMQFPPTGMGMSTQPIIQSGSFDTVSG